MTRSRVAAVPAERSISFFCKARATADVQLHECQMSRTPGDRRPATGDRRKKSVCEPASLRTVVSAQS